MASFLGSLRDRFPQYKNNNSFLKPRPQGGVIHFKKNPDMRTRIAQPELRELIEWLSDDKIVIKKPPESVARLLYKPEGGFPVEDEEMRKWYEEGWKEAMASPLSPLSSAKRLLKLMEEQGVDEIDIRPEKFAEWLSRELDEVEKGG
jgi:hypothetical protein